MAPVMEKKSPLIMEPVCLAGVKVNAFIDTGATTSCCRWGWYKQWSAQLGPLLKSTMVVVGVGNKPIQVKGTTGFLELEWSQSQGHCELIVIPTLEGVDVILGMDVLTQMDIEIQIAASRAQPNQSPTLVASARVGRNLKVPAGKSRIFFLENHVQGLTMFEPSNGLPEGLRGLPTLGKGNQMAVQLDNPTDKDILVEPEWNIGQLSSVQLVVKPPLVEGRQFPYIPEDLNSV